MDEAKADWIKDEVYGKIINLEAPGTDIFIGLNGYTVQCQDGGLITLPRAMITFLNSLTYDDWVKLYPDKEPDKVTKNRFAFIPQERVLEKSKIKDEIIQEFVEAEKEMIPEGLPKGGRKRPKREDEEEKVEVENDSSGDI